MEYRIVELLILKRGVKSICRELKVGKDRVREVRVKARACGYLDGKPMPMPPEALFAGDIATAVGAVSDADKLLSDRLEWIRERLVAGWHAVTIFEELGNSEVSRSAFYRFFQRHELFKFKKKYHAPELVAPIIHSPGEALILDWGKLCDVYEEETGRVRTLWAFVGVLGYSRYMMVRLVWTNDVATTLPAIESMLREMGGVAGKVTTDNPKCFALKADVYDPLLNPAFQRFSAHYHFTIECLPPRQPKKKGKVERLMPFVRRLFEAYDRENWQGLAHAQEYMNRKVGIANERRHGTTCQKPVLVFREKEASHLKPLPALAFERCEVSYPIVRRDNLARVMNKYYAVPECFVSKEMTALITDTQVTLYHEGKFIESYERLTHPDEIYAIKEHLQKPWQKIKENNRHYLDQAKAIGPNTSRLVENILIQGNGFVDTRKIWGILSLEKKYERTAIDWAAAIALEMGRLSSRFVEEMVQLHVGKIERQGQGETESKDLAPSKFARSMDVYKAQLSRTKH